MLVAAVRMRRLHRELFSRELAVVLDARYKQWEFWHHCYTYGYDKPSYVVRDAIEVRMQLPTMIRRPAHIVKAMRSGFGGSGLEGAEEIVSHFLVSHFQQLAAEKKLARGDALVSHGAYFPNSR